MTHTLKNKKNTRCDLKLKDKKRKKSLRIVDARPTCQTCRARRPKVNTARVESCRKWTKKGWK